MKRLLSLLTTVLLLFSMLSGFMIVPMAECTHLQTGAVMCEVNHPHKEFVLCQLCHEKIYTGNNQKKSHGDGTNGTCSQCGSHTYTGRTCTSVGTCVCGATIASKGHTLASVQYCDASHPHANFKYCTVCEAKVYNGGYTVKNHGDGTWGSGTCPDCGVHSFAGQSCTTGGICACGATVPNLGHTLEEFTYSQATHPHAYFKYCTRCWKEIYIGGYATKNHGDGTPGSGTCPECGEHRYTPTSSESEHPHTITAICSCGDILTRYSIDISCSSCDIYIKTVSKENTAHCEFITLITESPIATLLPVSLDGYIIYTNQYIEPPQGVSMYEDMLPFTSLYSSVISYATFHSTVEALSYNAISHTTVEYYDSSASVIDTQVLEFRSDNNAYSQVNSRFSLDEMPLYAIARAGFFLNNVIMILGDTTFSVSTYFRDF